VTDFSGQNKDHWCEQLYRDQAAKLLLYGRALGLSHSEAEDVLQEIFLQFLKLLQAPSQPEHYAIRAFRNRALSWKRSLLRRWFRELECKSWFESDPHIPLPEEEAMRCLQDLPKVQREVIVLKIWHTLTFEEIGDLLQISPHTAAGRYRYGLQKMKACLKETEPSHEERSSRENHAILAPPPTFPSPRTESLS
jgi:RNA polymerase sigma-70 factor, ECF subfamily